MENQNLDKGAGDTDVPKESPLRMEQPETEENQQIEDQAEVVEKTKSLVEEMQTVEVSVDEQEEVKPDMEVDAVVHENERRADEAKSKENAEAHAVFETEMVVKPKVKLAAKLEDLTDVESPDVGLYQYAIQFIEDLKSHEVSDGKMLVSQMHGLLFEGSHHLQIPFQNVRWICRRNFYSLQRAFLSCIILSYELESSGISYIFFTSEEITDPDLDRMLDLKISESSTSVSLDESDYLKVNRLLSGQPLEISLTEISVVPKGEYYSLKKFPRHVMLMVMDLECMMFFDGSTRVPPYQLIFWTEEGQDVVDAVKLVHMDEEIHLDTDTFLFVLRESPDISNKLKEMKPKEKHLFTDFEKLLNYAKQRSDQLPQLPQLPDLTLGRPSGSSGSQDNPPTTYWNDDIVADQELKIKREMDDAVLSISEMEDFQLQWIVIAADLEKIVMSGAIQESEIESGGLNPNNADHLEKALIDVSDHLQENRLDLALSRIQATRKIFTTSAEPKIRQIFDCSDSDLLKKLYFRSIVS